MLDEPPVAHAATSCLCQRRSLLSWLEAVLSRFYRDDRLKNSFLWNVLPELFLLCTKGVFRNAVEQLNNCSSC